MNTCPLSGTPLKLIPAGTSKATGKPYNAFYVCEIKGCKGFHNPVDTGLTQKPRYEAPVAPQSQEKDDSFWDKKAYKQCLWNYWLEHNSHSETDWMMTNVEFQKVYAIFQAINQDAEKRFSPVAQAALKANPNFFEAVQPDAPEDLGTINVESIPF